MRFAETGLFILDRLAETTGKPLALDAQGMRDLEAAVEARRKQRPFLDFRRATIYDLETVADFLRERRGGEALPPRTVLEMADEWNYGRQHERKSGWEANAYPFAEWAWNDADETSDSWNNSLALGGSAKPDPDSLARVVDAANPEPRHETIRRFDAGNKLGAGARLDWCRPWNRFWQFNAMAFGRAYRDSREFGYHSAPDSAGIALSGTDRYLEFAFPAMDAGATLEAAWYPDSRTSLSAAAGLSWWRTLDYLGSKTAIAGLLGKMPERKTVGLKPTLRAGGQYWMSPRLIATAGAHYSWEWNDGQDALYRIPEPGEAIGNGSMTSHALHLDAGLKYYLF